MSYRRLELPMRLLILSCVVVAACAAPMDARDVLSAADRPLSDTGVREDSPFIQPSFDVPSIDVPFEPQDAPSLDGRAIDSPTVQQIDSPNATDAPTIIADAFVCPVAREPCNGVCCDFGSVCIGGMRCVCQGGLCSQNGITVCVDVATNPRHCGDCNRVCPMGATCSAGRCSF